MSEERNGLSERLRCIFLILHWRPFGQFVILKGSKEGRLNRIFIRYLFLLRLHCRFPFSGDLDLNKHQTFYRINESKIIECLGHMSTHFYPQL